jgi:photosystem II stability/assembly factor-like uncharacterized protein
MLLLLSQFIAYSQFTWENPQPTGNVYCDVCFTDEMHGWVVGNRGFVMKTSDGGNSWTWVRTGFVNHLWTVYFVDNLHGWAAGPDSFIARTKDGGKTWEEQMNDPFGSEIRSIYFSDTLNGWTDGQWDGELFHTTDGGETWNSLRIGAEEPITSIFFLDSLHGWAGAMENMVYSTSNGGTTWIAHEHQLYYHANQLFFLSPDTGWIACGGFIWHTTDGCNSWEVQAEPWHGVDLMALQFIDFNHGYAVGDGIFVKTQDGGENWEFYPNDFRMISLQMFDQSKGWAIGGVDGNLLYTEDGGNNWIQKREGFSGYVREISCIDESYRIAIPSWDIYGSVLESYDGEPWQKRRILQDSMVFNQVFQVNRWNAWVCGDDGFIYHTGNAGEDWDLQFGPKPEMKLTDIQFLNMLDGFAIAIDTSYHSFYLLKTNDGGNTWIYSQHNFFGRFLGPTMYFTDLNNGYIAAHNMQLDRAVVLVTRSGGQDWEELSLPYSLLSGIRFVNDSVGFICGTRYILKTTDRGQSWTPKFFEYYSLGSVSFADELNGLAVGTQYYSNGVILKTADGGENWEEIVVEVSNQFLDVYFSNNGTGWISGEGGAIIRYETGMPVTVEEINDDHETKSCSVWPNPCDEQLYLNFTLDNYTQVTGSLYSINGILIKELLNCMYSKGNYQVPVNVKDLKDGVYIFQVEKGEEKFSGKFIVLH